MKVNRQQRRQRERESAAARRMDKVITEKKVLVQECEVELYFNAFAEQLHKHFGFGAGRIMKLWKYVDARIGDIAQGGTTKEEIERELEKEIGTICRFRD